MTIERLVGGLGAAVTGAICLSFAFLILTRVRLRVRGVRATAELLRFRSETAEDGDELYYAVVSFTLPDGTQVTAESSEGIHRPPRDAEEGDRVPVIYDPAAPSVIALPSLLPGRLRTREILALCVGCAALAFTTWRILADTF